MIDQDRPDRPDLDRAGPRGRHARRPLHRAPRSSTRRHASHDLLAMAAEFGDAAVAELRDVLAFYEAMRASEDHTR